VSTPDEPTGRRGRWFLPETPDVIGMLQRQAEATASGMDAFAAWAAGDVTRAEDVRTAEHDCDDLRRQLVDAVRDAFTTPLEPEDLFQLSRDLDRVINGAKDTVRESEVMQFPPTVLHRRWPRSSRRGFSTCAMPSLGSMAAVIAMGSPPTLPMRRSSPSAGSSASTAAPWAICWR